MWLYFQIGFSFIRVAVACSLRESLVLSHFLKHLIQGMYLKLMMVPRFHPYLDLPLDAIGAVCHQFGILSTDLHLIPCADFVETFDIIKWQSAKRW